MPAIELIDYLDTYKSLCSQNKFQPIRDITTAVSHAIDEGGVVTIIKVKGNENELKGRPLSDTHFHCLFSPLAHTQFLRWLDASYNRLTDQSAELIAAFLKENRSLEYLNLGSNDMTHKGVSEIALALQFNETLAFLDLSYNEVGDEGGMNLAATLQINSHIECLFLQSASISPNALIAFSTVIESSNSVRTFIISDNMFHTHCLTQSVFKDCMVHLSRTLRLNSTLVEVGLAKLGINDALMVDLLADAIKANVSIQTLDLSCNKIGHDGCTALAKALYFHPSIASLNLRGNSIQDPGAFAISTMLRNNTLLRSLYLDHNGITSTGLLSLADVLQERKVLKIITLWGNKWDPVSSLAFSELLERGYRFPYTDIDVQFYKVQDTTFVAQSSTFREKFNYSEFELSELELSENRVEEEDEDYGDYDFNDIEGLDDMRLQESQQISIES